MASSAATAPSPILGALGDFRWVRAHVSIFAVGVVLLVCINLLMGSSSLWSLTATGIWGLLLIVHVVVLIIARLSTQLLLDDDDEEIVLLPVKEAVIVNPASGATATWAEATPPPPTEGPPAPPQETVSWEVATNVAQVKRNITEEPTS